MKYAVVIVAAGKGERFSKYENKILYKLGDGKLVIDQTIDTFFYDEACEQIVLVLNETGMDRFQNGYRHGKVVFVRGGSSRQESVYFGLMAVNQDYVLIHDGARPWVGKDSIQRLLETLKTEDAAILTVPMVDTVKEIDENGYIIGTIDRNRLRRAQTPQGFHFDVILQAYKRAMHQGISTTDDAQLYQTITGLPVKSVEGNVENEKITTMYDVLRRQ